MNIAVIGLAFSHPYTYTEILQRLGHRVGVVWDDDPARLREFSAKYGATPVDAPEAALRSAIDGVIVTGRLPERVEHALACIERGVPTYLGKPMVAAEDDLRRVMAAARRTRTPVMSTSVLRYAPAMQALRTHLDAGRLGTVVAVRATSAHGIHHYLAEPHVWQDDPRRGGGTLITMGVHALDMLATLVGAEFRSVSCRTGTRHHLGSLSEDVALVTIEWADGLLGTAEIVGGVTGETYGVEIYGSDAILRTSIPKGDIVDHRGAAVGAADAWYELGYTGTMETFVEMCRTRAMPIPLEEIEAVLAALLGARASAPSGRPVGVGALPRG
jgi:predicted dehydrogenase